METTITTKQAWNAAFNDMRKAGIAARRNVRSCCRGCVTADKLGLEGYDDEKPYVWNFGGQGMALSFDWMGQAESQKVWLNHGNGSAETAVEILRSHGFEVEWDGTQHKCIEVKFW
ncbi:MAG TPA: hypothetical protein VK149_04205 [Sideroxyarcus sp.]|nr:hypothetical protein [Sideroxyarcus sp.]